MAEDPEPVCWMSNGHQHCVSIDCGDDESQQHCDARLATAVAALQQIFPPDP